MSQIAMLFFVWTDDLHDGLHPKDDQGPGLGVCLPSYVSSDVSYVNNILTGDSENLPDKAPIPNTGEFHVIIATERWFYMPRAVLAMREVSLSSERDEFIVVRQQVVP